MVDPSTFACSRSRAVAAGCPSRFTPASSLSDVAFLCVQTPGSCGIRLKRLVLATYSTHDHWLSAQRVHMGCSVVFPRTSISTRRHCFPPASHERITPSNAVIARRSSTSPPFPPGMIRYDPHTATSFPVSSVKNGVRVLALAVKFRQ